MTTQSEMAVLAAGSYWDIRPGDVDPTTGVDTSNDAPLPPGWILLAQYDASRSGANANLLGDGFSARVYRGPGGQIAISLAGTDLSTRIGTAADFLSGNVPLALGRYAEQAYQAALLYQRVKAEQGANITFTGHSLGGGLASVMAVWFDRPAYVFAPAPFESAGTRGDVGSTLRGVLDRMASNSIAADAALRDYIPGADFALREANVKAWAIKGELLEATLGMFRWIEGSSTALYASPVNTLDAGNKHSIDLHAAALVSPNFQTQANALPTALQRLFDTKLYGYDVTGVQQNVLVKMIRGEMGVRADDGAQLFAPTAMLTHFSNDLGKLGTNIAGLNRAAQDALIAQAIEWYYWQGSAYSGQEFFTVDGALLQYTTAQGAGLLANSGRTGRYVVPWLTEQFTANGGTGGLPFFGTEFEQWSISTGAAITATALDGTKTQMLIGQAGADTLTGGDKADMFLAGTGNDALTGGRGNDTLLGGTGTDTYNFSGTFGSDTIEDAGGQGEIKVDGTALDVAAAKKRNDTTWRTDDRQFTYTVVELGTAGAPRQNLVITVASGTNAGSITIRNWADGQLGIQLGTVVVEPPTINIYAGDYAKATNDEGDLYQIGADGNYLPDGAQADARDVLNGSADADLIRGAGGNDGLAGGDGDDVIEGGDGSDLLLGSWGADTLSGGEGNDFIFGSALGSIARPTALDFTPPVADGVELARGFSWVAYRNPGDRINGDVGTLLIPQVAGADLLRAVQANGLFYTETTGNIIDGGAGDDFISAGAAADVVHGGADNDDILGLDGGDVLFGDDGDDFIWGDGLSDPVRLANRDHTYIPASQHGNDVIVGNGSQPISGAFCIELMSRASRSDGARQTGGLIWSPCGA